MSMAIMPAFILSALGVVCNVAISVFGAVTGDNPLFALQSIGVMLGNMYLTLFVLGAITTATEWRHIHTSTAKKLLYTLTFPLFMFTYLPIAICAMFTKPEWKPIEHRVSAAQLRKRRVQELIPM